ncbi:cbb3-type cytochrome oxidase assembly protein CcoS [bacterium]|nr:cbb3-type cytochrome oxidase assembly protein CcoS [bacterium]MBU1993905.1 cbb3-type cytochrome oxidase assembly protein CcoS [bacterium]
MDNWIIAMMLGVSILLGAVALVAFLWAIKNGQFDDEEKFLNAAKFDGVDELNDAVRQEEKRKSLKKDYKPE